METDVTTVAAVLFNAADNIEKYGWQRGLMGSERVGFCAVGAIRHATMDLVSSRDAAVIWNEAVQAVQDDVKQAVTLWNDHQKGRDWRAKRRVVKQLRRTGNRILY